MFYLTYDVCEEFDTIEELLKRYKELKYELYEVEAWEDDKKITSHDINNT